MRTVQSRVIFCDHIDGIATPLLAYAEHSTLFLPRKDDEPSAICVRNDTAKARLYAVHLLF